MRRFRILTLLPLCIGCLCCLSCANNSISRLAKQQEKQGRHVYGTYEQLGYLLCSDSKTEYFVSKEVVVPIATKGDIIKYRVPSFDQNGLAVFYDKEEKVTSLSRLSPVGNIGVEFSMNDQNMIYVFGTKKNYAMSVRSYEDPELTGVRGSVEVDLESIIPISSELSLAASKIYRDKYQNRLSVTYDIDKSGRILIEKDNQFTFSGESDYIPRLIIPINQLHSKNTAQKIVNHLEEVASFEQVKNKLLPLQQLVADYQRGNEYLANKKYLNNWYYIEVEARKLHDFSDEYKNSWNIEARFSYENNIAKESYDVDISTADINLAELRYPRQMILFARFTNYYKGGFTETIHFDNARLVFCERD